MASIDIVDSDGRHDLNHTDPPSTALPEGSEEYVPPAAISIADSDGRNDVAFGYGAEGAMASDGQLRIIYNDNVLAKGPGDDPYTLQGVPVDALSEESYSDRSGSHFIEYKTEDGGIATKDITSPGLTHFSPRFGTLTVTVEDANGEPLPKSKVWVATRQFTTDSQGQIQVSASGSNVTVQALHASESKDVDVDDTQDGSLTFTHHGVEGKIRTPTGEPINGATVRVETTGGTFLGETETSEDGTYSIDTLPLATTVVVLSDPFDREFTSGKAGQKTTKNLPFDLGKAGGSVIQCRDGETGERVAIVDVQSESGDFRALSDLNGDAALVKAFDSKNAEEEITVVLAEDDPRYRTKTVKATVIAGETYFGEVELQRLVAVSNT